MIKETLSTKIIGEYDVAVCGGGVAGIAAAIAAARCGKKTLLIEGQFILGGLATAGLITIYLPICDGMGNQVSFSIAEELLRLSIKYGAEADYPKNWLDNIGSRTEKDPRFLVRFNPQLFSIAAEQLLLREGVDIMFGTHVAAVHKKGNKIDAIIAENKSGRVGYSVKSVVDATGDCDIAKFADAPTDEFRQGNVLAAWYYSYFDGKYNLNYVGAADIPDEEKKEKNEVEYLDRRRFLGLDGKELSDMTILSHKTLLDHFLNKRQSDKSSWPVTMPTLPQIRMTRKIVGEYVLSNKDENKYFEDSVGVVSNWKKRGPVYEVPFKSLYSKKVKNFITAGRCTSVNEAMWDIMRVIPCCAVTGQAAGTAAALSDNFEKLDVKKLQKVLCNSGVVLHIKDIIK